MSTVAIDRAPAAARTTTPLPRVTSTELRKMFDTRSGFWLMASIAITALLATVAVVLFAPDDEVTYSTFATAIGVPMTVLLPIMAILSVTSEWSQRSGLTTFTLVPHRHRVLTGKAIACVAVAASTIPVAFAVGAVGNLVGAAIGNVDPVWDLTAADLGGIALAAGVPLTELRSADGAGLEEMFLELTANDDRDDHPHDPTRERTTA